MGEDHRVLASWRATAVGFWPAPLSVTQNRASDENRSDLLCDAMEAKIGRGAVADVVGNAGGVVSGLFNEP